MLPLQHQYPSTKADRITSQKVVIFKKTGFPDVAKKNKIIPMEEVLTLVNEESAKVPQGTGISCTKHVGKLQKDDYSEEIRIINLKDTNREQEESSNNVDVSDNMMVLFWIRKDHHCMFDEYDLYICIHFVNYDTHIYGLVVRGLGYRCRGRGFDSQCYQIF
jgi:hypothetical protein